MTTIVSREEVSEWKVRIEGLYKDFPWFKSVEIESDDGGPHLVVRVTDIHEMRDDGVTLTLSRVKTCIVCVGKKNAIA